MGSKVGLVEKKCWNPTIPFSNEVFLKYFTSSA